MEDSKWTSLENSPIWIDDIIMHNGKLYAINMLAAFFEIDIADPAKVTMVAVPGYRPTGHKCFLVDLCGELVLLSRLETSRRNKASTMTSGFEVYKSVEDENRHFEKYKCETGMQYLEKAGHSWVQLENLSHHMVFIGHNHSISFDSSIYPRCKGNCIYFADYRCDEDDYLRMRCICKKLYHDVGVYHMETRKVKHFNKFCNASSPMNMVWLSPNFSTELEMQMVPG